MNLKIIIFAVILLGVSLGSPAAACVCQPGEVWSQITPGHFEWGSCNSCPSHQECDSISYWKFHGFRNLGACVSDCQPAHNRNYCEQLCKGTVETNCHIEYNCHHGQDYQSCGENQEQHRHWVDPVYGCVAVGCPAIPCPESQHCNGDGQCITDICPDDFQCPPDQICIDGGCQSCPEGQHVSNGQCVANGPPTCDPVCVEHAFCVGTSCICDEGYQMDGDYQCVEDPSELASYEGADDGHVDGVGFVLWDRLITLTGRDEGYYWHAFNETAAWLRFDGPNSFNESFVQVQSEYVVSAHGSGLYPVDTPGEWTIVIYGTNSVDNPTTPRVLGISKIDVEPLSRGGLGRLHDIVERTMNYIE